MTYDGAFPFLTVLVLLPAGAALAVALVPASVERAPSAPRCTGSAWRPACATLALAITIAVRYQAGNGGYRLVSQHVWASSLGISWHLGVDGISVFLILMAAILFPLAIVAGKVPARPRSFVAWMLLLEAGCLGSFVSLDLILFFLFFELTLVPVYFVDRGMGLLTAGLRGHQVLRVHVPRLGLPPGGDRGRRLHPPAPDRPPHLRPRRAELHPPGPGFAGAAVPGLHRRLRREGPDLPLPHMVARRLCPVAHRGSGDPGRRHGQDGHLRHHPLRPQPVPAGRGRPRPVVAHLGRGRHPLRGRGGLCHARHEAPGGVLLAQPPRVRRARDLRAHHPGRHRWRAADGEPRADHRRVVHRHRLDLRTAPDVAGRRAAGAAARRTRHGGGVHRGHDGRHRAARPQRLRGGVPRAGRHLPLPPVVGGGRHRWRGARRAVSPLGVPAGVPSRARRGDRQGARPVVARGRSGGTARGTDRVPGRVPQARARPHHPVGHASGAARRGQHRHPPAGGGERGPDPRRADCGSPERRDRGGRGDPRPRTPGPDGAQDRLPVDPARPRHAGRGRRRPGRVVGAARRAWTPPRPPS